MEAIPLPKRDATPDAGLSSSPEARAETLRTNLQVSTAMALGSHVQGWLMTLAYLPLGLILAGWAAYPVATGTGVPVMDTLVGLAVTAVGLLGSVGMGSMTLRQVSRGEYWQCGAQEMEEQLGAGANLFKREASLLAGEAVFVVGRRFRLSSLERPGRITAFHIFYGSFTLVFCILLTANFLRFGRVI